jgi:hypothetical protein
VKGYFCPLISQWLFIAAIVLIAEMKKIMGGTDAVKAPSANQCMTDAGCPFRASTRPCGVIRFPENEKADGTSSICNPPPTSPRFLFCQFG